MANPFKAFGQTLLKGRTNWLSDQFSKGLAPKGVVSRLTEPLGNKPPVLSPTALKPLSMSSQLGSMAGQATRSALPVAVGAGVGAAVDGQEGAVRGGLLVGGAKGIKALKSLRSGGAFDSERINSIRQLSDSSVNPTLQSRPLGQVLNDPNLAPNISHTANRMTGRPLGGTGEFPYPARDPYHAQQFEASRAAPDVPSAADLGDPLLNRIRDTAQQDATVRGPTPTPEPVPSPTPPRQSLYRGDEPMLGQSMMPRRDVGQRSLLGETAVGDSNRALLGELGVGAALGGAAAKAPSLSMPSLGAFGSSVANAATGTTPEQRDTLGKVQALKDNPTSEAIESAMTGVKDSFGLDLKEMMTNHMKDEFKKDPAGWLNKLKAKTPEEQKAFQDWYKNLPPEQKKGLTGAAVDFVTQLPEEALTEAYTSIAKAKPGVFGQKALESLFNGFDIGGSIASMLGMGEQWQALPMQSRMAYTASGLMGLISILGVLMGSSGTLAMGLGLGGLAGGYGYYQQNQQAAPAADPAADPAAK